MTKYWVINDTRKAPKTYISSVYPIGMGKYTIKSRKFDGLIYNLVM